jgi:hypothetical protein
MSEVWTKDHADYLERLIARSRADLEGTEEPIVADVQRRVLVSLINLRRPVDRAITEMRPLTRAQCPHCGNRDPRFIEDNGCKPSDSLYTLLCVARVAPGEDAFDGGANPALEIGADGKVVCGMQWEPNT